MMFVKESEKIVFVRGREKRKKIVNLPMFMREREDGVGQTREREDGGEREKMVLVLRMTISNIVIRRTNTIFSVHF